ncbi:JAB1 COP9 signalosome complex subunit 5 [Candida maltosa Xu316]
MSSCLHELASELEHKQPDSSKTTTSKIKSIDISRLKQDLHEPSQFVSLPSIDPFLASKKPWKNDPKYFTKTYISSLALMKMTNHAQSGGSIEIMGMLMGKITNGAIIVTDVYRLPVEGTETRVNAQNEAYEYMVRYLESNKGLGKNHDENIVGWYHSHPGYGCWLSGIDVSTQSLNQGFQDPYLAIVVDPVRTLKSGKVDIGAFRTYPAGYNSTSGNIGGGGKKVGNLPKSKVKDFGSHSDKYYSLDIEIYASKFDEKVISLLKEEDSLSWMKNLLSNSPGDEVFGIKSKDIKSIELIKNYELIQENGEDDEYNLFNLIELLKKQNEPKTNMINRLNNKKFESNFENILYKKMLAKSKKAKKNKREDRDDDDELLDESDLEKTAETESKRGISDRDEVVSRDGDEEEEDEDDEGDDEEGEKSDDDMIEEDQEDEDLLEEVGALARYNFNDNRFEGYEDIYDPTKSRGLPRDARLSRKISGNNRSNRQNFENRFQIPGSREMEKSQRFIRGGRSSSGNNNNDHINLEDRMHGGTDTKNKNQNLIRISKSIGLNEVFDLITLDTQSKLFS